MRPHTRVFPLVLAIVVSILAVALIPVDANERLCRDTPDAPQCDTPTWQPWILRWAALGY